jgi:hypothetical protein
MIKLPDTCKCCDRAKNDCYILFLVSRKKQRNRKRKLIEECPCQECIILPTCKMDNCCTALIKYIRMYFNYKLRQIYVNSKFIDYQKLDEI